MRLRPGFADAFFYLGAIYEKRGQLDHAIDFFTHALTVREASGGWRHAALSMQARMGVITRRQLAGCTTHSRPHGGV